MGAPGEELERTWHSGCSTERTQRAVSQSVSQTEQPARGTQVHKQKYTGLSGLVRIVTHLQAGAVFWVPDS